MTPEQKAVVDACKELYPTAEVKIKDIDINFTDKPEKPSICPCGIHRADCEYHK